MSERGLITVSCVLLVSLAGLAIANDLPRDCNHYHKLGHTKPGYFKIYHLEDDTPAQIYCNHSLNATSHVILRRINGGTTFHRSWHDYEYGFGTVMYDLWAGLKTINSLTAQGNRRLTIATQDWVGNQRRAVYDYFFVNNAGDRYRLYVSHYNRAYSTLPDDLSYNTGRQFATPDRPDKSYCAVHMKAGWWYNYCSYMLPTGYYYHGGHYKPSGQYYDGIFYKDYLGYGYSLKYIAFILSV